MGDTFRILAKNTYRNNNTRVSGLNNNDLIIGPSGAGKTRNYVKPNIMQCNESFIVTDTKNSLMGEMRPVLEENGYRIINIDFCDGKNSDGYNPFDFMGCERFKCNEQNVKKMARMISGAGDCGEDLFWDRSAELYIEFFISCLYEKIPVSHPTPEHLVKVMSMMNGANFKKNMDNLSQHSPNSFSTRTYEMIKNNEKAEKTAECIRMTVAEKINPLLFDGAYEMYNNPNTVDFREIATRKTAVFLNISDTDRSVDKMANIFYAQALSELCNFADKECKGHRLPVPVRFIFDDFASNTVIPDFDKIISNIRSREIYASIIIQSLSQLESLYDHATAMTIVNNCDNCLYLGGQDVDTANYMSQKVNKSVSTILEMPLDKAYLFTRGEAAKLVDKYNITDHPNYNLLEESWEEDFEENTDECIEDGEELDYSA
jgi:type IV secretion system protein VirD4